MLVSPKKSGGEFDPAPSPHCGFSKTVFSREIFLEYFLKPCFFVVFNIFIRHIFPENFIEIPQVVWKI